MKSKTRCTGARCIGTAPGRAYTKSGRGRREAARSNNKTRPKATLVNGETGIGRNNYGCNITLGCNITGMFRSMQRCVHAGVCATCSACTPRRTKAKYRRRLWCTIEDMAFENGPELSMKPESQSSRKSMRETFLCEVVLRSAA